MCKARLVQSVERKTLNLVVVGSSPTVGDCFTLSLDFYFTILFFFECIASPNIRQESLLKRSMGLQQQPAYAPQADIGTYSRRLGKSDTDAQERCPTAMPCHIRALCIKPMDHHDGVVLSYARLSELTRECARSSSSAFFGFPSSGQTIFVLSDGPDVWMRLWRRKIACRQPACVCIACF